MWIKYIEKGRFLRSFEQKMPHYPLGNFSIGALSEGTLAPFILVCINLGNFIDFDLEAVPNNSSIDIIIFLFINPPPYVLAPLLISF